MQSVGEGIGRAVYGERGKSEGVASVMGGESEQVMVLKKGVGGSGLQERVF